MVLAAAVRATCRCSSWDSSEQPPMQCPASPVARTCREISFCCFSQATHCWAVATSFCFTYSV